MRKPILCLDFDGVIHSYSSGWKGPAVIPDPPVPGAEQFIKDALPHFRVAVFSSRSNQPGGLTGMLEWAWRHMPDVAGCLEWPTEKPPSLVTLDDRALTFTGQWPDVADLLEFQPWNKRPAAPTTPEPRPALMERISQILEGIDRIQTDEPPGWWATPTGAKFGEDVLNRIAEAVREAESVPPPEPDQDRLLRVVTLAMLGRTPGNAMANAIVDDLIKSGMIRTQTETEAWAVIGPDDRLKHVTGNGRKLAEQWAEPGDTVERVAFRKLED